MELFNNLLNKLMLVRINVRTGDFQLLYTYTKRFFFVLHLRSSLIVFAGIYAFILRHRKKAVEFGRFYFSMCPYKRKSSKNKSYDRGGVSVSPLYMIN